MFITRSYLTIVIACFLTGFLFVPCPRYIGAEKIDEHQRISNARVPEEATYDYMVAIVKRSNLQEYCGGSLLTAEAVLSACHCLADKNAKLFPVHDYYASIGLGSAGCEPNNVGFRKFAVHENCHLSEPVYASDVGISFLKTPVKIGTCAKLVHFASVGKETHRLYEKSLSAGKICQVLSWGVSSEPNTLPHFREDKMKLLDDLECDKYSCGYEGCRTEKKLNNLCATSYKGNGTCSNTSGGPLMCDGYLVGMFSTGSIECGSGFFSNIFTMLGFVKRQITNDEGLNREISYRRGVGRRFQNPFLVSFHNVSNPKEIKSICVGSILTVTAVVTTSECLSKWTYSEEYLRYQDVEIHARKLDSFLKPSQYNQKFNVSAIALYRPCQGSEAHYCRVGIAFVAGEISLHTVNVQPLRILRGTMLDVRKNLVKMANASTCYTPTWGYDVRKPADISYNTFAEWNVSLMSNHNCSERFCDKSMYQCKRSFNDYAETCGVAFDAKQPCHVDPGSPLICDELFYGVVIDYGDLCSPTNVVRIVSVITVTELIMREIPNYDIFGLKEDPDIQGHGDGNQLQSVLNVLLSGAVVLSYLR